MTTTRLRRRGAALAAALVSTVLVLTACSSSGSQDSDSGSTEGYPVTIDTARGKITLDKKPERIVALDANYMDMLVSIDEKPLAFTTFEPDLLTNAPWLEGRFEADQLDPDLVSGNEVVLEAVAAYEPDLIIASIWGVPENRYEQFSQIAPVYVGREPAQATDWADYLTDLGELTRRTSEAARVIADVEAEFTAAKDRLPGLQGKTFNWAAFWTDKSQFTFGAGGTQLEKLGLVPAENQPPPSSRAAPLSLENIEQLAADVLLVGPAPGAAMTSPEERRKALEADPRFAKLPASQNGAVIIHDRKLGAAGTGLPSPSSMTWMAEELASRLESLPLNQVGR